MGSLVLAYIAGLVTLLSPCVLPLLPIILFGVLQEHKYGALALSAGLALSFTLFGFLVATVGFAIGLTSQHLQIFAGFLLLGFGFILLLNPLYKLFASNASALTGGMNSWLARIHFKGLWGQFLLGSVLGLVWAPCVGPTLGAAIGLAAQGKDLGFVFVTMAIFSIGTITPLLALGMLSRPKILTWKNKMQAANTWIKPTMGIIFVTVGVLFITGWMLAFEAWILERLPLSFIQFLYGF